MIVILPPVSNDQVVSFFIFPVYYCTLALIILKSLFLFYLFILNYESGHPELFYFVTQKCQICINYFLKCTFEQLLI